ncbi:MAG TPA: hypothetical protein VG755_16805, partial [Nannocystaceae bacterium]|nr:hypothetical protein [Nannocystaceae bacterium]
LAGPVLLLASLLPCVDVLSPCVVLSLLLGSPLACVLDSLDELVVSVVGACVELLLELPSATPSRPSEPAGAQASNSASTQ